MVPARAAALKVFAAALPLATPGPGRAPESASAAAREALQQGRASSKASLGDELTYRAACAGACAAQQRSSSLGTVPSLAGKVLQQ